MLGQVDSTEAGKLLTDDVRSKFEAALVKAGGSEAERPCRSPRSSGEWRRVNPTDAARDLIDRTILKPARRRRSTNSSRISPSLMPPCARCWPTVYRDMGLLDAGPRPRCRNVRWPLAGVSWARNIRTYCTSISSMGELLLAQGKLSEAEPYFREALATRRRVLGEEHPDTLPGDQQHGRPAAGPGQAERGRAGTARGAREAPPCAGRG